MGYDDAVRGRGSTEHSNEKDIVHCAKGVYFIMILCWLQMLPGASQEAISFKPPQDYNFPARKFSGENFSRSCKAAWFREWQWLEYIALELEERCGSPALVQIKPVFILDQCSSNRHS
ncbi:unnamed protein product [Arctogadus glacialis]